MVTALILVALIAIGFGGLYAASKALKARIEAALGPESQVGEIVLGLSAVEIRELTLRAPAGWPASETLRAKRIVVEPVLPSLLSAQPKIGAIRVEQGYLSLLRTQDGKLRLLPSLLEAPASQTAGSTAPALEIGQVVLSGAAIDFFDASVRKPAHRIALRHVRAELADIQLPAGTGQTALRLQGQIKGVKRDGTLDIKGWLELKSRDSEIATRLRGVDLVALQPYLVKATETAVRKGTLDLDLKSTVHAKQLRAPGTLTLDGLELAEGSGAKATFLGLPLAAVIGAMKGRDGKIQLTFTLAGKLDDPRFSINDSLARRLGSSLAEGLGLSLEGLARGVGSAAQGVGNTVRGLFGK